LKFLWALPLLFAGFCFWQATPSAERPVAQSAVASVGPTLAQNGAISPRRTLVTRPIQEIQVGHRVLAENPELRGQEIPQAFFDADTTRLIVLHQIKPDGNELTVETLVPLDALAAAVVERLNSDAGPTLNPIPLVGSRDIVALNELLAGNTFELNMPELGAAGPAQVVAVRPCPSFEPDDGTGRRLVTSVFRHAAANVIDLATSGSDESIGVTTKHPFWSEDRQAFIPAGELQPGERLRKADGTITRVARITARTGLPVPVFNFEVDGQHVYSVGADGMLVHNTCTLNISNTIISRPEIHHIASRYDPRFTNLFKSAGVSLESAYNKVKIIGHEGRHGWYNDYVLKRLKDATAGKTGQAFRQGLIDELMELRWQLKNTDLGDLIRAAAP
jgi:hypothetical protein